jgi:hypothetical protein
MCHPKYRDSPLDNIEKKENNEDKVRVPEEIHCRAFLGQLLTQQSWKQGGQHRRHKKTRV